MTRARRELGKRLTFSKFATFVQRATARFVQPRGTMTLRIDTTRDGGRAALRLIGRIRSENLHDLELQIAGVGPVVLDLEEVNLVDVDAVRFLMDTARAGIELRNCPPFIRAWIDREERDGTG